MATDRGHLKVHSLAQERAGVLVNGAGSIQAFAA